MAAAPSISVVIPALNEAAGLPETLRRVREVPEVLETILVDGGSRDATGEVARADRKSTRLNSSHT